MSRAAALAVLRPVQPKDGDEAPFGQVTQPAALDAITEHPGVGLTPARAVAIFRLAEDGYPRDQCNLFDDIIERNATVRQLFDGRRAAVAGKEWSITPDGTEGDAELAARVLDDAHRNLQFGDMGDVLDHQLTYSAYGYGGSEIEWGVQTYNGRSLVVPVGYVNVPARRFRIEPLTDELRLLTTERAIDGEALAAGKWWITTALGRLARAGLMRPATWLALWTSYALRDWLIKSERYGIPLALAKYDPLVEDNGKAVAIEVVKKIGSDGGAAVPKDLEVEIVELKSAGDGSGLHGALITYANRELAKLIAGGTLSTDNSQSGQGSYAQAEVHASGRFELVQGDANRVQRSWGQCVAVPFMRFNGLRGRAPMFRIQIARDQTPAGLLAAADTMANKLGVPVSVSQMRQITGLRMPLGDDDAARAPATPAPGGPA